MERDQRGASLSRFETAPGEYLVPDPGENWPQEPGTLYLHNYLEIGRCHRGRGVVTIAGKRSRYGAESFLLVPAGVPHGIRPDEGISDEWEFALIDLERFVREQMQDLPQGVEAALEELSGCGQVKQKGMAPVLGTLVSLILGESRERDDLHAQAISGYLRALVVTLVRQAKERQQAQQPGAGVYTRRAQAWFRSHFAGEVRMADAAKACGLSESHFRRIFVEDTGMKPADYLNLLRVNRACELLEDASLSTAQVGEMAGFQTASSFHRNFRQLTGMTPRQWRSGEQRAAGHPGGAVQRQTKRR